MIERDDKLIGRLVRPSAHRSWARGRQPPDWAGTLLGFTDGGQAEVEIAGAAMPATFDLDLIELLDEPG